MFSSDNEVTVTSSEQFYIHKKWYISSMKTSAIDLFCGIGGLSYGLKKAGISVDVGIDLDETCQYAI
jgi:ribosomal protein L11 methylase PrmA